MFRLSRTLRPIQSVQSIQKRFLSIHEYRGAELLKQVCLLKFNRFADKQYGVGVPDGYPAFSPEEAEVVATKLGSDFLIDSLTNEERMIWSSKPKSSQVVEEKEPSQMVSREESDQSIRTQSLSLRHSYG